MNLQSSKLLLCIVVVQNFNLEYIKGDGNNRAKVTKVECKNADPEYVANNMSCRVKAVRRDLYAVNIQVTIIKPADNLMVQLKLYKKANTYQPFLIDIQENFCDFLDKRHISTVMKVLGSIYLPYSNVNSSCPLMGVQLFKDMPFNPNDLPSVWPSGDYRLVAKFLRFSKDMLTIFFEFQLQENTFQLKL